MSGLPDSEPVLLCDNLSKTNSNAISRVLRKGTHTRQQQLQRGDKGGDGRWEWGDGRDEMDDERGEERKKKNKRIEH